MQLQQEIEAKFTLPNRPACERLVQMSQLAGFVCGPARTFELQDTYLDTANYDVLAAGYACRVREWGDHIELGLKSLGQIGGSIKRRQEYRHAIHKQTAIDPYLDPTRWPAGPLRKLIQSNSQGGRLQVLFSFHQHRTVRPLLHHQRPVVELSLDQVCFDQQLTIYEAEFELLPAGTEVELQQIIHAASVQWQLAPSIFSKFERGLARINQQHQTTTDWISDQVLHELRVIAAGKHRSRAMIAHLLLQQRVGLPEQLIATITGLSHKQITYWSEAFKVKQLGLFHPRQQKVPRIQPQDIMSVAGRKIMRRHFGRMLNHELGTRLGIDIEELHDMRVATRRLRAAFRIFGPCFETAVVQPFLKNIKSTGRALGPVRDLDVFEQKTRQYLAGLPAGQEHSLDKLWDECHRRRDLARGRMLEYLDSQDYECFVQQYGRFLQSETIRELVASDGEFTPVQHVAPQLINERFQIVQAYQTKLQTATIQMLHALRIDFKHLRYTLEFFKPVLNTTVDWVIQETKTMQDHLGNLNDAEVAIRFLQSLLEEQPDLEDECWLCLQHRKAEKQQLLDTFLAAWDHFNRPELHRKLEQLVAVR